MDIKGEGHVGHMFDSFYRKVLRNAAGDYYNSISRRRKHEILLDDYWNLPYTSDKYSLDQEVYEVLGEGIMFIDASIIAAPNFLSVEGRTIVFVARMRDLPDREIAERLNMVRRTLTYRKPRFIKELRGLLIDG